MLSLQVTDDGTIFYHSRRNKINSPMVGIVVTTSPSFNLYKIVVLPAASRPTEKKNNKSLQTPPGTSCECSNNYDCMYEPNLTFCNWRNRSQDILDDRLFIIYMRNNFMTH